MNNVRISLKKIVSETAPATNKINAINRNFPFKETSLLSDFIEIRANKSPAISEISKIENIYICNGNLYSILITPCNSANTEGSVKT